MTRLEIGEMCCYCLGGGFTALPHISGHIKHGQLSLPHCSSASLLEAVYQYLVHFPFPVLTTALESMKECAKHGDKMCSHLHSMKPRS